MCAIVCMKESDMVAVKRRDERDLKALCATNW